jgi:ribosomal protein S12 methylthiotransferase accessory factor
MAENVATSHAVTVVTHEGGLRLVADVRGHRVPTDQPIKAGGADSAAMPLDLIGAALATCIGLSAVQFCRARELPTDGLQVELWQRTAHEPYRVEHYDVRVALPAGFPGRYRAAVGRAARTCAAFNTLTHQPTVQIDVIAERE